MVRGTMVIVLDFQSDNLSSNSTDIWYTDLMVINLNSALLEQVKFVLVNEPLYHESQSVLI